MDTESLDDDRTSSSTDRTVTPVAGIDWMILLRTRPHILLQGTQGAVDESLADLIPSLRHPLRQWSPETRLPEDEVATLVIPNLERLAAIEQRRLSIWLGQQRASNRLQVVSTTTAPLYDRVAAGDFAAGLYYRLNTVLLHAPCHPARPLAPVPVRAAGRLP